MSRIARFVCRLAIRKHEVIRDFRTVSLFAGLFIAALSSPVSASIEGTYSGSFLTGKSVGAYSYIHDSTAAKKPNGDAGYTQYAGGNIIFAMDSTKTVSFDFNDAGNDGLGAGDTIDLSIQVDLLEYDGSLNSTNSLTDVVATLTLNGTLTVGGSFSDSFTHGIHNITSADTDPNFPGLAYQIDVTKAFSSYSVGDKFTGDGFFQSGKLADPFNGIGYDPVTKTLSFAIWGDSANQGGDTGTFNAASPTVGPVGQRLGFDIFIEAQIVPEAASVFVWGLLTFLGVSYLRHKNGG